MRLNAKFLAAAAGLVLAGAAMIPPAKAMPLDNALSTGNATSGLLEYVRGGGRGGGGGHFGGGHFGGGARFGGGHFGGGGRHFGGGHFGGYRGGGYAFRGGYGFRRYGAPFIGGLALGAVAAPYYYGGYPDNYVDNYVDNYDYGAYAGDDGVPDDAVAACAQRFKSYDPQSGTYLGYDGQRHPCP